MPDDRFIHRRSGHGTKPNLLTDGEHRVWVQYILSADDFGVMRGTHHPLQNDNDHLATRSAKEIQRRLDTLVKVGLIRRFEHQGKPYVFQHDWQTWQKVSYPRTTTQPAPPAEMIAECDEPTQRLFALHPGGAGRTRQKDSGNVPETVREDSPLMRGGAPAKRLTANGSGERLPADGSEGSPRETAPPIDVWLREFTARYPAQGRTAGHLTEVAFCDVLLSDPAGPSAAYAALCERTDVNNRSHQWRVKGMIPRLDRYLREGLHLQVLPEHPPSTLVNDKNAGTLSAAAAILGGKA